MNTLIKFFTPSLFGLFLIILGWVLKKYLVPWLGTGTRLALAQKLAIIADDITDWLVTKFPDATWDDLLDRAVDKLVEILGIEREVAERVTTAAFKRKGLKNE